MNKERRGFAEEVYSSIYRFLKQEMGQRFVHNFLLTDDSGNVPADYWGFVGIFPKPPAGTEAGYISIITDPNRAISTFNSRILQVELPERVRQLRIPADSQLRLAGSFRCAVKGLPSIVLAFGETRDTQQESILLACIVGITPAEALRVIQNRTKEAIAKSN